MVSEKNSSSDLDDTQQHKLSEEGVDQVKLAADQDESNHVGSCPPTRQPKETDKDKEKNLEICRNHCLRELRVEIQEIAHIIDLHTAGQLSIMNHLDEIQNSAHDANSKIVELKTVYIPALKARDIDSEIVHLWQLASGSPFLDANKSQQLQQAASQSNEQAQQDRLRELKHLKTRLMRLIYLIGYTTILERLNRWIGVTRVGYALPFHRIFEDEIESAEDRQRILQFFSLKPEMIEGGLVDLTRGIVLCYPVAFWDRFIRHLIVFLLLVLSFVLVWGFSDLLLYSPELQAAFEIGTDQLPRSNLLLMSWLALLLGIVAHVLVAGAKLTHAEFRQFPMPLRDWGYYLSARTSNLMYKTVLAFLVFMAMYLSLKGDLKLFDAFLIGYSFDSVVELVGASMEKSSSTKLATFTEKLGVGGK